MPCYQTTFCAMSNPLVDLEGLPPFSQITPEVIEPAIDELLQRNRAELQRLLAQQEPYTWDNLIQPLEEMDDRLSRAWSPVGHMNAVVNSDEMRQAYNACLPKLSEYSTEMGQNKALYEGYHAIADSEDFDQLETAQQTTIHHALRDFHLGGVDLPEEKKQRYKEISQRLSELSAKFSENVLDATHAWEKHIVDESALSGMTASGLAMARQAAERKSMEGWLLTLDFPSYHSVVTYVDDRSLREAVYRAFVTRASDQCEHPEFDNTAIIEEILSLKHELAQLLGFENYAQRSLATKMAETPEEVLQFLGDLAQRAKPAADAEMAELKRFATGVLGISDVQAWDVAYVSEKMRGAYYSLSQEDLKPYFPVDRVVPGLFALVNRLYGV
ncbi:MAG TPA: oligopeptidase A, partial [Gammaproteobacteria bacterium]|nr:oligopeptidase A [Gammaproteobacteria bacterium]